jgi:UDP-N-acetylmuramoyl-L-alanyl-D-glutamate--2,6-diaminopimelate ligase
VNELLQICHALKKKVASLGTLGLFVGNERYTPKEVVVPSLTTPGAVDLHRILDYVYGVGVSHFVFEASSHALDQERAHSVDLVAAAFTNFASDHLDYHKTNEEYLKAKLRLFSEILPHDKPAVVSRDFPEIYEEVRKLNGNIISFGLGRGNLFRAESIREFESSIVFDLSFDSKKFSDIEINLVGGFQVMNVLCAISLAYAYGFDVQEVVNILPSIKPLNGRMEHIKSIHGGDVYIDFAHTNEGLRTSLASFKKICKGRLICVFGCGGDRDRGKRPEMGETASKIADIVIVTDDNPRTEDPKTIRAEIISRCPKAIEIGDRREAIRYAISLMNSGDFVAVIGKGHEECQIYADRTNHFSDREEILLACV